VSGYPDNILLFPGVMLGYDEDSEGLSLEVHYETRLPFSGKKVMAYTCYRGLTHFTYTSYKNGKRNGLNISFLGNGIITQKNYFKDNLYQGLNEHFYQSGLKSKRATYEPWTKRKSKLVSLEVWQPSGKKCPYSYIDQRGDGVQYSYDEDGKISDILFYENFDCRAEVFPDDEGQKLQSAWLYTGKRFNHKEIKLL
jgi:antitoxin component YwqK of YwqJK toxin-antitoxin module